MSFAGSRTVLARRPTSFNPSKDPLDMANMVGPGAAPFDFPLTRPTLLKMEKQRKILHYLRLEQLQFKDLVAFRQPFQPPPSSTHFVQVRHQHYQGESHPASRKVTISVPVSQLELASNPKQLHKFKLLAGPRFTPSLSTQHGDREGTFKLSCELFPSERMNEKWCSDTLDKLVAEACNSKESFEDVPLDLRGIKKRLGKNRKLKKTLGLKDFPQEWLRPQ
ncbi:mitochondrial 37S ribosomal protein mS35 RSM24 [Sporobolomyces koalae]|uniref:mitochondrial 37S ribosomal protein mS35 RSM24 n=1 Tax=Sporobolomyces koalae TaxID=500713 RepID=UPI003171CB0E